MKLINLCMQEEEGPGWLTIHTSWEQRSCYKHVTWELVLSDGSCWFRELILLSFSAILKTAPAGRGRIAKRPYKRKQITTKSFWSSSFSRLHRPWRMPPEPGRTADGGDFPRNRLRHCSAGEGTDPFLICYLKIKCGGKRKKLGEKKKKENRSRVGLFTALKYMDEGRAEPSRGPAAAASHELHRRRTPPRPSSLPRSKQPQVPILYSSVTALETCPSP